MMEYKPPIDCPQQQSNASDDNNQELSHIRRPPNAFMIFGKQFRKELSEKFSDLPNKDISKMLGNEWRNLDQEKKNQYYQLAEEANRQHFLKYPGYYYNPLEARQRKAERKLKVRNRPSLFGNQMYPMARHPMFRHSMAGHPMFGYPMLPRMCCPQSIHFPTNYSNGGLVRLAPYPMPPPYLYVDNPIKREFIARQVSEQIDPQMSSDSVTDLESVSVKSEAQETDLKNSQVLNIAHLSSLMPPMHNPGIEVMTVPYYIESQLTERMAPNEAIVTEMVNAVVQQEYGPTLHIKEEITQNQSQDSYDIDSKLIEQNDY